jgi:hypothetical protein
MPGRPLPPGAAGQRPQPGSVPPRLAVAPPGNPRIPGTTSPRPAPERRMAAPAVSLLIEMETFGPDSSTRWQAEPAEAVEAAPEGGLKVRNAVTLRPTGTPVELPPRTRRLMVRLVGGAAEVRARLRSADGTEREVPLTGQEASAGMLSSGSWSLVSLRLTPRQGESVRLTHLAAETMGSDGLFAVAVREGERLRARIHNLGEAPEHAALEAEPGRPLVETDLGPHGAVTVRLPLSAFTAAQPPAALTLRWRRGTSSVSVR